MKGELPRRVRVKTKTQELLNTADVVHTDTESNHAMTHKEMSEFLCFSLEKISDTLDSQKKAQR